MSKQYFAPFPGVVGIQRHVFDEANFDAGFPGKMTKGDQFFFRQASNRDRIDFDRIKARSLRSLNSRENLFDLMQTRMEIEGIALRWSLEKGSVDWEANLLGAFHRLSRQVKIDPQNPDAISAGWSEAHSEFHAALVSACGSPTLISIRSRLFEQAERYVALSIVSNGPLRDDVTEHRNLLRAAVNRECDKMIELNRLHINRTLDKVAALFAGGSSEKKTPR